MPYDRAGNWLGSEPPELRRLSSLAIDDHNKEAIEWVANHPDAPVCLIGDVGTGKSTLLAAIYAPKSAAWWTEAEDLCDDTKRAIGRDYIAIPADEVAESRRCKHLFLDDLGTERPTDHNLECIVGVLRARFNRGLATWISTNLSLEAIAKRYSDRIADRIVANCKVIELGGPSRREPVV